METLKRWLDKRFVLALEIGGYTLAVLVGICAIYSFVKQIEVLAKATGEVLPPQDIVNVAQEAVLVGFDVRDGQQVEAGDPVCRIATSPEAQQRVLAERLLEQALGYLKQGESSLGPALESTQDALSALPRTQNVVAVTAPADGVVKRMIPENSVEILEPDTALLALYRADALLMDGVLDEDNAQKVAVGQPARVQLPDMAVPLLGEVISVEEDLVRLRFPDVPAETWQRYAREILLGTEEAGGPLTAEIIVGTQSLFQRAFGRKGQS